MTCLKKRPFQLCISRGLGDTDDEKTPEYPLSDDHPLSLYNRAKLLSECTHLSPKCVMTCPFSSQIISEPIKPTKTAVDSTNDILHTNEYFTKKSIQQNDSGIIQNSSYERLNKWLLETSRSINTLESVPDALDLALWTKSKGSVVKQNISVSLMVRSLLDSPMEGTKAFNSISIDNDPFNNKGASVLNGLFKSQSLDQISSKDNNNNSGPQSPLRPTETNVFHRKSPIDDSEISKIANSSQFNFLTPNSKTALPFDYSIDADVDDKNVPPHLSPVDKLCSKTEVAPNSQSPTFPPTLMPIKMYSFGGSPICEYSIGDSGTAVDNFRPPLQNPTNCLNLTLKQTTDKGKRNYQKSHGSPEKTPSECPYSGETRYDANIDDPECRLSCETNTNICGSSVKCSENDKEYLRIESQCLSTEKRGVVQVGTPSNSQSREQSNGCQSEKINKTHTFESHQTFCPPSHRRVPLDMGQSNVLNQKNSGGCDGITNDETLSKHDKRESPVLTSLSITLPEKTRVPLSHLYSDANSGTSVTSSLCYPHSIQSAYYVEGSGDFEYNHERGIVQKHTEQVPSHTVCSVSICPVTPKTTLAHPPSSSTKESFALPPTALTSATVSSPFKSTAPNLQSSLTSSWHQPLISSSTAFFPSNINHSLYVPLPIPLVTASTSNVQLVKATNNDNSKAGSKRHLKQKSSTSTANPGGYSLQKRFFHDLHHSRPNIDESEAANSKRRRMPQNYNNVSTVSETPQNYPCASTIAGTLINYNSASTVAGRPQTYNIVSTIAETPQNYNTSSTIAETPKMPALVAYPPIQTNFHVHYSPIQNSCNPDSPEKPQTTSLQSKEKVGGGMLGSVEVPNTFVSTPTLRVTNEDPLRILSLHGMSPTIPSTKYPPNMIHPYRDPLPSTNQHEPLDLSSKHQATLQKTPRSLGDIPAPSVSPVILNLERSHQPVVRYDTVLAVQNSNSQSSPRENIAATPLENDTAISSPKPKSEHLKAVSEKACPNPDTDRCNEVPPSAQQEASDPSSPVGRNCPQNIADAERESSMMRSNTEQRKRKPLPIPMENNVPLNPDEKSYSQLAFAAIMSKRKKTLDRRKISTNIKHFLHFLRRDDAGNLVREGRGCEGDETDNIMAKLRNGELIDLTVDNDDILSISSDENSKDVNELSESTADLCTETHQLSRHVKNPGDNADNGNDTYCPNTDSLSGLSCERTLQKSEENALLIGKETDFNRNSYEQPPCDSFETSALLQQLHYVAPEQIAVLDPTHLSRIKEQSLAFSGPQKAWMAKRIQDIISKNAKLLPEYMQPFDPIYTSPTSLSLGRNMSKRSGQSKTHPHKIETEKTSLTNNDFQNPYAETVTLPLPLKIKRSMSLDTDSSSSLWSPNTDIPSHSGSEIYNQPKSSQCEMYVTKDAESVAPDPFTYVTEDGGERQESPSPYKTVWQTQFLTDRPPSYGEKRRHSLSNKSLQSSDDIFRRLELMQNAASSLNQSSGTNSNREKANAGTMKKRRKRSAAKRSVPNRSESVPKVFPVPVPTSQHNRHVDIMRLPPPVSAPLGPLMPSTFVVTPYYAMAYPVCYPAFQRPPAPNQTLVMPPHGSTLNGSDHRKNWSNGRKPNRKIQPPSEDPTWKRTPSNIVRNGDSDMNNFMNHDPYIPPTHPNVNLQTGINMNGKNGTIQNGDHVTKPNTVLRNTNDSDVIIRSHLPDHPTNVQGLLDSESNCDTYRVQTRNEDGLTVLSMQYTGESESNDIASKSSKCVFESNQNFQHRCTVDLNLLNSVTHETEFSPVVPLNANNHVIHSSVPPTNDARNLATLALASEKVEKIPSPMSSPLVATTGVALKTVPPKSGSDSDTDTPELTVDLSCSPEDSLTTQIQRTISDVTSPDNEKRQSGKSTSLMQGSISEKERQVTEMLATMMHNRNLSSRNKPNEN